VDGVTDSHVHRCDVPGLDTPDGQALLAGDLSPALDGLTLFADSPSALDERRHQGHQHTG
jgi:hypothetical protein